MVSEESRYQMPALQFPSAGRQLPMAAFLYILGFQEMSCPDITVLGIAEVLCLFQYHHTALIKKWVLSSMNMS